MDKGREMTKNARIIRELLGVVVAFSAVMLGFNWSLVAAQSSDFHINIIGPGTYVNQRSFKLGYAVNAAGINDKIAVKLWQNDTLIRSEFASSDDGNSGSFAISVPADGTYSYYYTASAGDNNSKSEVQKITVDATPPKSADYGGATRSGSTYTVMFKAPPDTDVTEVRIFGSVSTSFTADPSTQIGKVQTKPSQQAVFTYTAADNKNRSIAIQAFDKAGNGSDITGDSNTVVARGATTNTYQLSLAGGSTSGQVEAKGSSVTDINTNAADVLSEGNAKLNKSSSEASDSWIAWAVITLLAIASLAYASRAKIAQLYSRVSNRQK